MEEKLTREQPQSSFYHHCNAAAYAITTSEGVGENEHRTILEGTMLGTNPYQPEGGGRTWHHEVQKLGTWNISVTKWRGTQLTCQFEQVHSVGCALSLLSQPHGPCEACIEGSLGASLSWANPPVLPPGSCILTTFSHSTRIKLPFFLTPIFSLILSCARSRTMTGRASPMELIPRLKL